MPPLKRGSIEAYKASDERQRWFAQQGDELIISTPGNGYWLRLAKALAEQHAHAVAQASASEQSDDE